MVHEGKAHSFADLSQAVQHASRLLPNQAILENFIHHNPLDAMQSSPFQSALEDVSHLESYMSPGERAFSLTLVDPRKRVNEALVELSSSFLDRGAAKWAARYRNQGFLYFFAVHESLGFAPWRSHARSSARSILTRLEQEPDHSVRIAESILKENLLFFGISETEWMYGVHSMLHELRGWAGMFWRMETHPLETPPDTLVRLIDFCAVQSVLARSSIETLTSHSTWSASKSSLAHWLSKAPKWRRTREAMHAEHSSAVAFLDQSFERHEALENQFKLSLVHAIGTNPVPDHDQHHRPAVQLYTCIDDRECSLRRYVEEEGPVGEIETFGVAGFFGIPIDYRPADGRDAMILAPEGQQPSAILLETDESSTNEELKRKRQRLARIGVAWESASFSPLGSLLLSCAFPFSVVRLVLMGMSPSLKHAVKAQFRRKVLPLPHTNFQLPLSPEQAAPLLAHTFLDIGIRRRFAPIIIILGHGAVSVNNPFAAAYNCGACGGREGGPNARLVARLANDRAVRRILQEKFDISIPDDTVFVGGVHNTTTDVVEFFDVDTLPESHRDRFDRVQQSIEHARGKNALERCRRFLLAKNVRTPEEALRHVQIRASDFAEARPELNHATNAAVVVGRRDLTKGRYLDRRVFLSSYDPHSDDADGTNLEHVLTPALLVCSGINLEYLFSTANVESHGAGSKAPLNVVGNIGVLQGTTGDLRPGLPSQMTEMHTPIRALFIVDAPIERVEAVLARRHHLRDLVRNEWIRLVVRDPVSNRFFKQSRGNYLPIAEQEASHAAPLAHHRAHGMNVARQEALLTWASACGMVLSCAVPIVMFDNPMNPRGPFIAACGTLLSLPVLAFSRRYLHGEFMYGRFSQLCMGLLCGFNLVATAPSIEHALAGWSLFGFASTFLIGAYNDRPTVRSNATFAFAAYRISDFALLTAAVFSAAGVDKPSVVAACLLLAALFKSSQFPLTALFARSMEGPTPASALGYAGLSAHVGIVLLTSTMPLWFGFDWARITLASVGMFTAVYGSLISKIRADRKGAIAYATSATIGLMFVTLALGYRDLCLMMAFGHAAFRMTQILRSPNIISETQNLRSALGRFPWPRVVPDWLFRLSWTLRRIDSDFHLINVLHAFSRHLNVLKPAKLSKYQQWIATAVIAVLAGAPFTPVSHFLEHTLMEMLPTNPGLAAAIMMGHFAFSVVLIRLLFLKVLDARRFHRSSRRSTPKSPPPPS